MAYIPIAPGEKELVALTKRIAAHNRSLALAAWQHPYVNVFKLCDIEHLSDINLLGDVTEYMDRVIGKKVFKIRGTIPASNFMQLPKKRIRSLGLTGRFCYIQFRGTPVKVFLIHIEVFTKDQNLHRITISNMFSNDPEMRRKSGGIQIPFPNLSHRWCVLGLDIAAALKPFTSSPFHSVRSFQLCSWMTIRSIYTSDLKFSLENLPRDMAMSHSLDSSVFEMVWLPSEPAEPNAEVIPVKKPAMERSTGGGSHSPKAKAKASAPLEDEQPDHSIQADQGPSWFSAATAAALTIQPKPSPTPLTSSEPSLVLERINSFSGEFTRSLTWAPHSDEVVFIASSALVAMKKDGSQRFFLGHTSHVTSFAFDLEGHILASCQEGKQAIVRVWDYKTGVCAAVLNAHASGMVSVSVSPDGRALAAVGMDSQSKQVVVVWDISHLPMGGKAEVMVRHVTEYNIRCLRFSLFEEDQLVACGRDNIRFYRLKGGQLRGISVRLSAPDRRVTSFANGSSAALGPNIFTDIAFESGVGVYRDDLCRVYVSSAAGTVFEVNYKTRALLCVYQLHSSAINSLIVRDSFCVTGSDDKLLRVWPMDFSDFLMEAEHEGPVTSLGVSQDGLSVCVGTENGAIGILSIPSQGYNTILRSHTGSVLDVATDPLRRQYCTVSSDSSIRIWDLDTHEQMFEFNAPSESVTSVAYHPLHHEIACGFDNGRVRVFDVATTKLIQDHKQHRSSVLQVVFSPDGGWFYSAGEDGGLCVYDVAQVYSPVKFLPAGGKGTKMCVSVSSDGKFVGAVARDPFRRVTSLLIFLGGSLEPYMRIETDVVSFTRLAFGPDNRVLWALTDESRLDCYELTEGRLVHQAPPLVHRLGATCLVPDPLGRCIATGGNDHQIKLWTMNPTAQAVLSHSAFIGHSAPINAIAFKGEDRMLSVGEGASLYIWRIQGGVVWTPPLPQEEAPGVKGQSSFMGGQWVGQVLGSSPTQANFSSLSLSSSPPASVQSGPGFSPPGMCGSVIGFTPSPHHGVNAVWISTSALFAYAAGNTLVVEDLATRAQKHLAKHTSKISCLAVSCDARVIATASSTPEPSGLAEIFLWDTSSSSPSSALAYHPHGIQAMAFSHSDRFLVSIGAHPERSVALWDLMSNTEDKGELREALAVGRTRGAAYSVAWLPLRPHPQFLTVGEDGLLLWTLKSDCLELVTIELLEAVHEKNAIASGEEGARRVKCTALACEEGGVVFVATSSGSIFQVNMDSDAGGEEGGRVQTRVQKVVDLGPLSSHVTQIKLAGPKHAAIGTQSGVVVSYDRSGANGVWEKLGEVSVDGSVESLSLSLPSPLKDPSTPHLVEAVCASSMSTLWFLDLTAPSQVPLVCGHNSTITSLSTSPLLPGLISSSSHDGALRVWQVTTHNPQAMLAEPLVEFQAPIPCLCSSFVPAFPIPPSKPTAQLPPTASESLVAGYKDGSIRLFGLRSHEAALKWMVARHAHPVVSIATHPSQPKIISASSDGALAVTDLNSSRLVVYIDELVPPSLKASRGPGSSSSLAHEDPSLTLQSLAVSGGNGSMTAAAWHSHFVVFSSPWEEAPLTRVAEFKCSESAGARSKDVPAAIRFIPMSTRTLAYSSPLLLGKVVVFDYRLNAVVRSIGLTQMIVSISASPDGRTMGLGGIHGSVFLSDVETGRWTELKGHYASSVSASQFTTDGLGLVTSVEGTMIAWRGIKCHFRPSEQEERRSKLL